MKTIEIEGLSKHFEQVEALSEVDSQAAEGDIIGLVGRNGAGKSTLLEILAGLQFADRGRARVLGVDCESIDSSLRQRMCMVLQDNELFDWLTVRRQLSLTSRFYSHWNRDRVDRMLQRWQIPAERRISSLSRGQRQMLAIVLALGPDPELLLLDEPASALDPVARREFLAELVELACESARTIVFSTHLVGDLERIANRVWLLDRGRLRLDQETDTLREHTRCLTIRGKAPLRTPIGLPGTLREQVDGSNARIVVHAPDKVDPDALGRRLDARVEVERVGLESLCLEFLS